MKKRFFDVIVSGFLIVPLAAVLTVAGLVSFLVQGWPVLYVSRRFVTSDREILIVKLRSMVVNVGAQGDRLTKLYMKNGYLNIPLNDDVYTRFGRLLELTQLVEAPQIFSVLKGQMSLVGNRPLPSVNVEALKRLFPDNWSARFAAPAGITGIAQVVGKYDLDAAQRLYLEELYCHVYESGDILKADLRIIYYTVLRLALRKKKYMLDFDDADRMLQGCMR